MKTSQQDAPPSHNLQALQSFRRCLNFDIAEHGFPQSIQDVSGTLQHEIKRVTY